MADNVAKFSATPQLQRDTSGKFLPGSGGRPVGSRNRVSNEALAAVRGMKDEAILQLREKIIAGDWAAIQFCLERILPKGRTVEMDGVGPNDIAAMLQSGEITTIEAKDIATALARLNEIGELVAIKERLVELEQALAER